MLQLVLVSLTTDTPMIFGGIEGPAAYAELLSIGAIGGDKNKKVIQYHTHDIQLRCASCVSVKLVQSVRHAANLSCTDLIDILGVPVSSIECLFWLWLHEQCAG